MDFKTAIKTCVMQKYATFSGRAARSEYWYFALATFLLSVAIQLLALATPTVAMVIFTILILGILLPGLGVAIRRLHDIDRSGWWYLIVLVPFVGVILLIYWFVKKGTSGPNRYGEDPLPTDSQ